MKLSDLRRYLFQWHVVVAIIILLTGTIYLGYIIREYAIKLREAQHNESR